MPHAIINPSCSDFPPTCVIFHSWIKKTQTSVNQEKGFPSDGLVLPAGLGVGSCVPMRCVHLSQEDLREGEMLEDAVCTSWEEPCRRPHLPPGGPEPAAADAPGCVAAALGRWRPAAPAPRACGSAPSAPGPPSSPPAPPAGGRSCAPRWPAAP